MTIQNIDDHQKQNISQDSLWIIHPQDSHFLPINLFFCNEKPNKDLIPKEFEINIKRGLVVREGIGFDTPPIVCKLPKKCNSYCKREEKWPLTNW